MAKKRRYQAIHIQDATNGSLLEDVREQRITVAVDVAKTAMVAAVMDQGEAVLCTLKWQHPKETAEMLELVCSIREKAARVEVVMEPSGVYGDALRWRFLEEGFEVFKVSPKKTHDMAEVYDGVPSKHDAKDAAIIATLHFHGRSTTWLFKSQGERELVAELQLVKVFRKQASQNRHRLGGQLSRYWPEAEEHLDGKSAALLELLMAFGGPKGVASAPEEARRLLRSVGRGRLLDEKIDALIASASNTSGVLQLEGERHLVRELAAEVRRNMKALKAAEKRIAKLTATDPVTARLGEVVGKTTAAVLCAAAGDFRAYDSPRALLKGLGLNLREHSSGKQKGGLHITRRGPGTARMYLYLAALRLLKTSRVVKAWFAKKVARDGGRAKKKGITAIMRKLVMGLWHVARGAIFDPRQLYDVRRLDLA